ncbi:MAG: RNA polymerase sigma factor [Bryobacterales bacterium]|nr:RNA polymerase sigma factor [Bryobacterales bacterium]
MTGQDTNRDTRGFADAPRASQPKHAKDLLCLDAAAFEAFHAQTARPLRNYLNRLTGNTALADELVQESYYRFLRSQAGAFEDRERRNYLFRIATNLVNDLHRSRGEKSVGIEEIAMPAVEANDPQVSSDVQKVLSNLKPRERELVWLAYVEGSSHREIADILGLREVSIRPMLFRARQKLLEMLRAIGYSERETA